MGVPTFKFKLLAFAMGAFIGGLSGALFAGKQGFIYPAGFPLLLSILFIAAVVVGGAGNRWGVMRRRVVVAYFPERFREFAGLAGARLRPGADAAGDLPAAGSAAARGARSGRRRPTRSSKRSRKETTSA